MVAAQVDLSGVAAGFLSQVEQKKFAEATRVFDARMKAALPAEKLGAVWESLATQFGAYQGHGAPVRRSVSGFEVYSIPCRFERATMECRVTLNGEGKVSGFFVLPAAETAPVPAPPAPGEVGVTVGKEPYALPGTLTLPQTGGPFPAVVLVHGSGPLDRDETIGPNKPFRDLAEGLRARGVATLRYEKRTFRHKASMPEKITLREEVVDDAAWAVDELAKRAVIDRKRIFVVGHSLGGMVAARIAAQSDKVAGLVLMAAPTRPFLDVFRAQFRYIAGLPENSSPEAKQQLEQTLAQVKRLDPLPSDDGERILGAPAVYWRDLLSCRPAKEAESFRGPMLIVQGERDYQVTMDDFAGWKRGFASRDGVTLRSYPKLNHLFIEGEAKSTPADTMKPGHVSEAVIDDIARWVKSRPRQN
ncbi:MAG: alpha/beta fold hydrolase [Bryobacteraceae bacterium]